MRKAGNQIEGQISLFDFLEIEPKPQKEKAICKQKGDCEAYGTGCGGTIDPCRFGGPFKWSKPICFEDMTYDRRGKGHPAPEWMNYERCENCIRWTKYPTDEQPPDGWGCIGWCAEHQHKTKAIGYCMNFEALQQEEKT